MSSNPCNYMDYGVETIKWQTKQCTADWSYLTLGPGLAYGCRPYASSVCDVNSASAVAVCGLRRYTWKTPSSAVVHNNNACRSAGAEIYPGWSCFPRRCTACMEQSTTISSNCFLPRSIQTPAEDISIRAQFWLTFTNFSLVIIL